MSMRISLQKAYWITILFNFECFQHYNHETFQKVDKVYMNDETKKQKFSSRLESF